MVLDDLELFEIPYLTLLQDMDNSVDTFLCDFFVNFHVI